MRCLPTKECGLPLCFASEPSWISDRSSKVAAALRCDLWRLHFGARWMHTVCLPCQHSLARDACRQRAAAFLFASHGSRKGSPTNRARLRLIFGAIFGACTSVRGGCKLFAYLTGTRTRCLPSKDCRLPLCFAREPSGISDRSSKVAAALRCELWRLHFGARWMHTVCGADMRCLPTKECRLPLCFASEP